MDKCLKRGRASLWDWDGGNMGRMWRFNAIKLPDGGLCNKEPWIGVLCNKSWHPTTGQWGSRSFLETDWRFLVTNLWISSLLMHNLLCNVLLRLRSAVQRHRGLRNQMCGNNNGKYDKQLIHLLYFYSLRFVCCTFPPSYNALIFCQLWRRSLNGKLVEVDREQRKQRGDFKRA